MNICISQTVHNSPKKAKEVGRSPYLVRRAERVLFINSANSFVLFPCRTTRAPCRIMPLALPIILKFMSPPLRCPQWDVTTSDCLRSWKTIFNMSDNTLSQISPVHYDIKEWMPTSLVKSLTTNHILIKGNMSHIEWKGNECHTFNSRRALLKGPTRTRTHTHTHTHTHTYIYIYIWGLILIVFSKKKSVSCSVLYCSRRTAYIVRDNAKKLTSGGLSYKGVILFSKIYHMFDVVYFKIK